MFMLITTHGLYLHFKIFFLLCKNRSCPCEIVMKLLWKMWMLKSFDFSIKLIVYGDLSESKARVIHAPWLAKVVKENASGREILLYSRAMAEDNAREITRSGEGRLVLLVLVQVKNSIYFVIDIIFKYFLGCESS